MRHSQVQVGLIKPKYVSTSAACKAYGLGLSTLYKLLGSGQVRSVAIGRRRLVELASMDAYYASRAADSRTA